MRKGNAEPRGKPGPFLPPARLITTLAVLATMCLAAPAQGAVGDLFSRGCLEVTGGPEDCARSAPGLDGASAIAIGPRGRSLYATAFDDDALVHLRRNPRNGRLGGAGCVDDAGGPEPCGRSIDGLDGAIDVAISSDGRHVYALAFEDRALLHFRRHRRTGRLRLVHCVDDADLAAADDVCAGGAEGMLGARSLALGPEGGSLYVTSSVDDALVLFSLDRRGRPRPRGCLEDDDKSFFDDCPRDREGLASASDVAISPDGRSLYVASFDDDAVTRFRRNPRNGAVRYRGCVDDNDPPSGPDACSRSTDGLESAHSLGISPDGRFLYAGTSNEGAIAIFRLGRRGQLRPRGCVESPFSSEVCATVANGFGRATEFAIDGDGVSLYVAGIPSIAPFRRLPRSGALIERACIEDDDRAAGTASCKRQAPGLDGANALALSPDERFLYVASSNDGAVSIFRRRR